jgi:dTDP-4-amino-4,6-dideoxygalactose transaminase
VVEVSEITFNRASVHGNELSYVRDSVSTGASAARGPFSARACDLLRAELGASAVLLTTSCTSALELSSMLLNLTPKTNVIVPSFTFVTTALAFTRNGAELRFADIDPATLCISPTSVSELVDSDTRAIVPVHYAGISADLEELEQIVDAFDDLSMVEDNAHGLFGSHRGRPLGSFGRFSTLSFHETKNFSCGEGGALVINQEQDVPRADVLYDKGTNRAAFLEGEVDRYTWVDQGSSFGMSDMLAGFLLGQLEERSQIMARRKDVFDQYHQSLSSLQERLGFQVPVVQEWQEPAYHMFYVLISDEARRTAVLRELNESGVRAVFHYQPLHNSLGAQAWTTRRFDCPVTDSVSSRIIRLPFFTSMATGEIERVVETLVDALERTA